MSNRPRQHHYVPKFYLAGFTSSGTADGELFVLDQARANGWMTSPANAAKQRDYYALELGPDVDPAFMEQKVLAPLEGEFSRVIRRIVDEQQLPPRYEDRAFSDFNDFINFVAIMVARVPRTRAHIAHVSGTGGKEQLRDILASPEKWEKFKRVVHARGNHISDDDRDKLMQLALSEGNLVELKHDLQTSHVMMMEMVVGDLLPALASRNWSLGIVADNAPDLICSDVPVGITPTRGADLSQPTLPSSPNTVITIPITRRLIALGYSEARTSILGVHSKGVAGFNHITATEATQLFASGPGFTYLAADRTIWQGIELLECLRKRKQGGSANSTP